MLHGRSHITCACDDRCVLALRTQLHARLHAHRVLSTHARAHGVLMLVRPCLAACAGWGENIQGQASHPIELSQPDKLVLSPHVYGHGNHPYFNDPRFPANLPAVWWAHWARIPTTSGHAAVVGEWGGIWEDHEWNGRLLRSTRVWQAALLEYMRDQGVGHFYWTRAPTLHPRPPQYACGCALSPLFTVPSLPSLRSACVCALIWSSLLTLCALPVPSTHRVAHRSCTWLLICTCAVPRARDILEWPLLWPRRACAHSQ